MGNAQGPLRRDRADSGGNRRSSAFPDDDQCPVQMKIPKASPTSSIPSMQFDNGNEYPVVVKWTGGGKQVSISGSWDDWKRKIPLVKSHDDFTTIINLHEGKHEFKFYVDGQWICDSRLPKTHNPVGSENNIITIDHADFEVFDALDKDLAATTGGEGEETGDTGSDKQMDPQKSFGQDIPDRHQFEQANRPPVLPPHLLQVILNKDTPMSCDPNVLPEPNHVMLNHLYALSIKGGVMVLSATHRYRKNGMLENEADEDHGANSDEFPLFTTNSKDFTFIDTSNRRKSQLGQNGQPFDVPPTGIEDGEITDVYQSVIDHVSNQGSSDRSEEQVQFGEKLILDTQCGYSESSAPKKVMEFVKAVASKTPPPSPDGITADDPPVARCETCDVSFITKRERSEHLKDVHGVEKPFKCEHCRARFPYSSSLYNHIRIHSESRPFKCNLCNSAFRWKNSLRHHRLHIHKEEPTSVQIAAKCVLEGKKAPPKTASAGSARKTRTRTQPSYLSANCEGASMSVSADEIEKASLSECIQSSGACALVVDVPTTNPQKRKRKPKSTKRRNEPTEPASGSASGKGHTCGHCEKEFPLWADLVSHIKECAEREKAALDDDVTPQWISADGRDDSEEYEECHFGDKYEESDSDSSAEGGLVIDQDGKGMSEDEHQNEQLPSSDAVSNEAIHANHSNKGSKKRKTVSAGFVPNNTDHSANSSLEQRVEELEKHLSEITRNYEDRIGNLELAIFQMTSKLPKKE